MKFAADFSTKIAILLLLLGGGIFWSAASGFPGITSLRAQEKQLRSAHATQTPSLALTSRVSKLYSRQPIKQETLTRREFAQFKRSMQQEVEQNLALAGLNKLPYPPEYSNSLKLYRAAQSKVAPATAPFLGLWVNSWEPYPPYFSIAVFPSKIKNRVCIVEEQDNEGQGYQPPPGETIPPNPPPKFSTARIVRGQVVGQGLWLDRSLIKIAQSLVDSDQFEFLGAVHKGKQLRLYASKQVAELDSKLPQQILQDFKANQCLADQR